MYVRGKIKGAAEIPQFAKNKGTPSAIQFVNALHELGVLTVPAGENIVRLLPPLNIKQSEVEEALEKIEELPANFVWDKICKQLIMPVERWWCNVFFYSTVT